MQIREMNKKGTSVESTQNHPKKEAEQGSGDKQMEAGNILKRWHREAGKN